MKYVAFLAALACLSGCTSKSPPANTAPPSPTAESPSGHDAHRGHAGMTMPTAEGAIVVTTEPTPPKAGEPADLKLMIHEPDGTMVEKFDELHTKLVHLIIIRKELDEFAHVHPEIDASGNMTVAHQFRVGGEYLLFADYQPAGKDPAAAKGRLKVSGNSPPAPQLTPNVPGTVAGEGLGARIELKDARAGESAMVKFQVLDEEEKPVDDLQPYLGAMGHLVIVSADGNEYVHAHPMNEKAAPGGAVEFMAHFPTAGVYKGWGQFQRWDTTYTVPFVVEVE